MAELFTRFGFEWTWDVHPNTDVCEEMVRVHKHIASIGYHTYKVYVDDGLLEICTPPLLRTEDIYTYYRMLKKYAKTRKWRITPYNNSTSGGGHINISFPEPVSGMLLVKDIEHFFKKMSDVCRCHAYLSWIFNDPSDDDSDLTLCDWDMWIQGDGTITKGANDLAVVQKKNRLEWRFFDMPRSLKELRLQVEFMDSLYRALYKHPEKFEEFPKFKDTDDFLSIEEIRKRWKSLLNTLALNVEDYSMLWRRNYLQRVEFVKKEKKEEEEVEEEMRTIDSGTEVLSIEDSFLQYRTSFLAHPNIYNVRCLTDKK